jgi:hypothetical protein
MNIKDTDIGRLWSTHYPRRKIDAASRMFCFFIVHAIRNIAQNNPCGGIADRLRTAVTSLEVPEDEFFQFTEEETKAR